MRTSNILVSALMILERRGEAMAVAKQSLAIGASAFGPDDPRVAEAIESMGGIAREQENYKEEEDDLQRALCIKQRAPNMTTPDNAHAQHTLAYPYVMASRYTIGGQLHHRTH